MLGRLFLTIWSIFVLIATYYIVGYDIVYCIPMAYCNLLNGISNLMLWRM